MPGVPLGALDNLKAKLKAIFKKKSKKGKKDEPPKAAETSTAPADAPGEGTRPEEAPVAAPTDATKPEEVKHEAPATTEATQAEPAAPAAVEPAPAVTAPALGENKEEPKPAGAA
ncbi:hypothetical protein DL770_001018 [Monosporascus sp. CRB-9-2]|nr:hypothetical protein DL770_001018 [Monosporascus sp. CRB-9-2]